MNFDTVRWHHYFIALPIQNFAFANIDPVDNHAVSEIRKVTGWDYDKAKDFYLKLDYSWTSFVKFMIFFAREPNENEIELIKRMGVLPLIEIHKLSMIPIHNSIHAYFSKFYRNPWFKTFTKNKMIYRFRKK